MIVLLGASAMAQESAGGRSAPVPSALPACVGEAESAVEVIHEPDDNLFRSADGTRYVATDLRDEVDLGPPRVREAETSDRAGFAGRAVPLGPPDRWNRVPAWIVVDRDGKGRLWQAERFEQGLAVFAPARAQAACADALRRAEGRARRAGVGVWRNKGAGLAFSAVRPKSFQTAAGRYVIVRGRIVSLGKTDSTRYLNFGRYWKTDLTGTLKTSDEEEFDTVLGRSGRSLDDLAGRFVELRGTVEDRDGPHIALRHPEQLVVLDD
ncbi:hypothetical protein [Roseibium sp.]|uniref:hypothetical protein n=1 Tax=Roseibium sp. TaxID=1936156 RepID=UPI003266DAAA